MGTISQQLLASYTHFILASHFRICRLLYNGHAVGVLSKATLNGDKFHFKGSQSVFVSWQFISVKTCCEDIAANRLTPLKIYIHGKCSLPGPWNCVSVYSQLMLVVLKRI